MKAAGTKRLLIDLRRNDGGNSFMSEILVYFLYGKQKLLSIKAEGSAGSEIVKYSDFYFDVFSGENLETINKGRTVPLERNDYDFAGDRPSRDHCVAVFEDYVRMMPTFDAEYRSEKYSACYRPEHVVVICSPGTFSAGYTLMRRLAQAGAIVVGTPSAQAGNCFGDIMNFNLKNSGLPGSVSRKYFEDFPGDAEWDASSSRTTCCPTESSPNTISIRMPRFCTPSRCWIDSNNPKGP